MPAISATATSVSTGSLPVGIYARVSTFNQVFATHEVSVRGRHLHAVFLAVSQGQAAQVGIGQSANVTEGDIFLGPLVTEVRIDPSDEAGRARR